MRTLRQAQGTFLRALSLSKGTYSEKVSVEPGQYAFLRMAGFFMDEIMNSEIFTGRQR